MYEINPKELYRGKIGNKTLSVNTFLYLDTLE